MRTNSAINIEEWLAAKVSRKFSRVENTAFVTGTGVGQPRGFLTYADGTTLPGTIEQNDSGASGAFVADPNGPDVLLDTIYDLKTNYHANAAWFMARLTVAAIRKFQDSNGAYMWQPSVVAGQPSTLLAYPVAIFSDMPAYTTADALAIAFGDMGEAYQIVDRMGLRVVRDPYTAKPFTKFYTTKRVGGDVTNFEAIKLIKFGT